MSGLRQHAVLGVGGRDQGPVRGPGGRSGRGRRSQGGRRGRGAVRRHVRRTSRSGRSSGAARPPRSPARICSRRGGASWNGWPRGTPWCWRSTTCTGPTKACSIWSNTSPTGRKDRSCVLVQARPDLFDVRPSWGGGKRNAASIYLDPLTPDEDAAMIDDLLPGEITDELRKLIVERSEGNPLYTEEIIRMLIDRGVLRATEGVAVGGGDVGRRRGRAALDPGADLRAAGRIAGRGEVRAPGRGRGRTGVLARCGGAAVGTTRRCDPRGARPSAHQGADRPARAVELLRRVRVLLPASADPRRRVRLPAEGAPREQAHEDRGVGRRAGGRSRGRDRDADRHASSGGAADTWRSSATRVRRAARQSSRRIAGRGSPAIGRRRCGCRRKRSSWYGEALAAR